MANTEKNVNRREVLKLARAVAGLGAGLGIVLKPGMSWAEEIEASKHKGADALPQVHFKIYKIGVKQPVFSAEVPELAARQILGVEGSGSLEKYTVKLERTADQNGTVEMLGETTLQLVPRKPIAPVMK
jgi:hypothetical protein